MTTICTTLPADPAEVFIQMKTMTDYLAEGIIKQFNNKKIPRIAHGIF